MVKGQKGKPNHMIPAEAASDQPNERGNGQARPSTEGERLMFDSEQDGRLDKVIANHVHTLSRSRVQALIEAGNVRVDDAPALDNALKLARGQRVTISIPPPIPATPQPQAIALNILYEDADILVLNKQAGLVVHPGAGNPDGTLVNALLAHFHDAGAKALSSIGGVARPGIVHRLDKDTSGLMVVAKNDIAHQALTGQFADRSLSRTYLAIVRGRPSPSKARIDTMQGRNPRNRLKMAVVSHGGRQAVTDYATHRSYLDSDGDALASVVQCQLSTGRTHQIRVHMAHIGCPILGDPLYGATTRSWQSSHHLQPIERQALHASALRLCHPRSGEDMAFECSLPTDFRSMTEQLELIARDNT